ncbi:MAG: DALR anticodon-binding domain-containing protein, partial [Syntrophales bacterium]|nr:DALR anticodon-binding domain-containing protein [Syntrophales bacterium]
VEKSVDILGKKILRSREEISRDVLEFFRARFENQLLAQGHTYDVVDAVLATGVSDLCQALKKIEAMEDFRSHPDFQPLAIAFKRVGNIIKTFGEGNIDPGLFQAEEEKNLYRSLKEVEAKALGFLEKGDYKAALVEMARLRQPVDAFFNAVMVMAKEENIKFNRLSLLTEISGLFHRVADFSKIVTEG